MIDLRNEANAIDLRTKAEAERLRQAGRPIKLVDIIASSDGGVLSYRRAKMRKASSLGIAYEAIDILVEQSSVEVLALIDRLNADPSVTGIMLSTPIYPHLTPDEIIARIEPTKDVDGLSPHNVAYLATNQEDKAILPATALAAIHIIEKFAGLHGKHVVVLGRGRTVGRPVAQMALNRHATTTICHSQTNHLELHTKSADILIAAMGRARFVTGAHVKEDQIVIDCGITSHGTNVVGDVDAGQVAPIVKYLTPVPGGVGTLTNSFLFSNLIKATALQSV